MNGFPLDQRLPLARDNALPPQRPVSPPAPSPKFPPVSSSTLDQALFLPLTPTTPVSPTTPLNPDTKSKKSNPLNDLIDTEKQYVDQLTGIIRKVAAAWSRTNLPPPDLDTMFRSIEGVYRANRGLYSKLKEIGTNPSSPKALGDLLMRWIDDLRTPYTTYCTKYCTGFDVWEPVQANPKLPGALATFSTTCPPASSDSPNWTLDGLFLLPKLRLKYYKKLYSRLLKTTESGRSDYRLLVGALDTLEFLLGVAESRNSIQPGESSEISHSITTEPEDEVVIDTRPQASQDLLPALPLIQPTLNSQSTSESDVGSPAGGSFSGDQRSSQETSATSDSRASTSTLSMPLSDLERRLRTDRTLDIFTMKPKAVALHMNPPQLTFTRELKFSGDCIIRFVPRHSTEEVIHRHAHIFLLSDLFLVCERMSPEEQAEYAGQGADMWLCYPPLAGKVLRVIDLEGRDDALQVAVMRKEFLTMELPSVDLCNTLSRHLKECVEFSSSLPPPSKNPPPPVPPINPMFLNRVEPAGSGSNSPTSRVSSPHSDVHGLPRPPSIRSPPPDRNFVDSMNRMRMDDHSPVGRRAPPGGLPSPHDLRPSASAQTFSNHPPPFGPGHVQPPARSTSFTASAPGSPSFSPRTPGFPRPPSGPHMGGPPHSAGPQHMGGPPHPQGIPHIRSPPPHNGPRPHINNGPPFGQPLNHPGPGPMHGGPFNGPPRPGPGNYGLPPGPQPPRPPSEPSMQHLGMNKPPSTRSLSSQYSHFDPSFPTPPVPSIPGGFGPAMSHNSSFPTLPAPQPRPLLPSANARARSVGEASFDVPSPPGSPVHDTPRPTGPLASAISAQMKCKVFLQQQHAQWKSLGSGRLKLYHQDVTNIKQLVVEADDKNRTILVSTIVLTDGVERVGKTGVAIELSDKGARSGIIYMIQLRNEKSAGGLFDSLLAGSDRSG